MFYLILSYSIIFIQRFHSLAFSITLHMNKGLKFVVELISLINKQYQNKTWQAFLSKAYSSNNIFKFELIGIYSNFFLNVKDQKIVQKSTVSTSELTQMK